MDANKVRTRLEGKLARAKGGHAKKLRKRLDSLGPEVVEPVAPTRKPRKKRAKKATKKD